MFNFLKKTKTKEEIEKRKKEVEEIWSEKKKYYLDVFEKGLKQKKEESFKKLKESFNGERKYDKRDKCPESLSKNGNNLDSTKKTPIKILISTDIGSDIDDVLALVLALHLPPQDVIIVGIVTEFGNVGIRREVAQALIDSFNEQHKPSYNNNNKIPCFSGDNIPIWSHRNPPFLWHTGLEGIGAISEEQIKNVTQNPFQNNPKKIEKNEKNEKEKEENTEREEASDFMIEMAKKYSKELIIVCLGSLTNVAKCLKKDKEFENKVQKIVFMGLGVCQHDQKVPTELEFEKEYYVSHTNHNIRQDLGGAIEVINNSNLNMVFIGHTVTHAFWWETDITSDIRSQKSKLKEVQLMGKLLDVWLSYRTDIFRRDINGTCPHDLLTITEAIYPNSFVNYVRGDIFVHPNDSTVFLLNPISGRHYVSVSTKLNTYKEKNSNDFINFLDKVLSSPLNQKEIEDLVTKINNN